MDEIEQTVMEIPLTRGQVALVSSEDFERVVAEGPWFALWSDKWYARNARIKMHRFIMNAPEGMEIDHRDADGLNNCRSNLRISTRDEGARNRKVNRTSRSGHRGVHETKDGIFRVHVGANGKRKWYGNFKTLDEAVAKQAAVSKSLHGDFCRISNLDIDSPAVVPPPNPKVPRSGFTGVRKNGPNFQAYITCAHRTFILGQFKTREEAVRARDAKAIELFGD